MTQRINVLVLTPTLPEKGSHLRECVESVAAARAAAATYGVDIGHLVVVDGPGEIDIPAGPVRIDLSRRHGIATARTYGLRTLNERDLSRRHWVYPLDSDDVIDAEGWEQVLRSRALEAPHGWIATNRVTTDGERRHWWIPQERLYAKHEFAEEWLHPSQIHPNSVFFDLELLLRIGGWAAIPSEEDVAAFLRATSVSAGLALPHVVTRYRIWTEMTIAERGFAHEYPSRQGLIINMVNAMRTADGRAPIAPLDLHHDDDIDPAELLPRAGLFNLFASDSAALKNGET